MSILVFANNAATTIAGAITNTALTVNLAPGAGALFPPLSAGQYFVGTFNDAATGLLTEIVEVTARSGDTLTIVRAQESTTALAWNSGDLFSNLWTAGSAAQMLQQGQVPSSALVNYGVDTGTADAINATLSPTVTSLTAGLLVEITPAYANATTTPTMNVSGLGAKNILRFDGTAVIPGDIQPAPAKALFVYDLSSLQFMLINPAKLNTGLLNIQTFTASGTYTPTAGTKKAKVTFVGNPGGGGGSNAMGGSQYAAAGGGGSGGWLSFLINTMPTTVTVTIGAAGAGGYNTAAGGTGGTCSFGSYASITGGTGGSPATQSANPSVQLGGSGGVVTWGAVSGSSLIYSTTGQPGGVGIALSNLNMTTGAGGSSPWGAGGGIVAASSVNGINGSGHGAGGSGAVTQSTGGASTGGTGSVALIIVEEYA